MGNKQQQLIRCGFDDKIHQQQAYTTRQQAIQRNKYSQNSVIDRNTKLFASIQNSSKIADSKPQSVSSRTYSTSQLIKGKGTQIPQHQNLTQVKLKPTRGFSKLQNSNFYQKQYSKCLDEIIQSRYNTSMHFPENQMISLLEALVYSLAYMTKKGYYHHDFYPTNIFYENGRFIIKNPKVLQDSSYSITQQQRRFSFLSPQMILQVLEDTQQQDIHQQIKNKADVFAIGMIMLEFCTLEPSSECYDPQTYSLVDSVIKRRLNKCLNIYNPLISQCINLMLEYQVQKRIPPKQLSYCVHSKVSEIRAKEINNQMSRINQNSRISMSAKIPHKMPNIPQSLPPPNLAPPGYFIPGQTITATRPQIYNSEQINHTRSPERYNKPINSPKGSNKLNPFEQIQEDQNQNEESPDRKQVIGLKQQYIPKQGDYNTVESRNDYDITNLNGSSQTLDDRIKRILEKSKKYH